MSESLNLLQHAANDAGPLLRVQSVAWNELPHDVVAVVLAFQNLELRISVNADDDTIEISEGGASSDPEYTVHGIDEYPWSEAIGKPIRWGWHMTNQQGYQDAVQFEFARNVSEPSTIIQLVAVSSSLKVLSVQTKQEVADEKLIAVR
jgi:Family of unknown function (DUF6334)